MDEISSGSLSPDTTDRASPLESGIGTASPPRSTDRRITKRECFWHFDHLEQIIIKVFFKLTATATSTTTIPSPSSECQIKDTWDRIRRTTTVSPRSCTPYATLHPPEDSVWIKRESVHTQTGGGPGDCCSQEAVDSSSGLDDSLPRAKAARPSNFPLGMLFLMRTFCSNDVLICLLYTQVSRTRPVAR